MRLRSLILCLLAALAARAQSPEARTRQVLDFFLAEKYEAVYEMFAPETKQALSLADYKTQAGQIKALGKVQSMGEPRTQSRGGATVVTIPVHWASLALDFGVTWNSAGQIAGIWFTRPALPWEPPAYAKPDSFTSREITVGDDEWKLPGTLSVPKGKGPFPGLVLVHGSGPNDRDETVGGAKVFKDLAEGLASRGIAVLRYDKRTRVYGAKFGANKNFTMNDETVEDAVRAAALLRTQESLDPKRVFVLGHSQGGYMVPRIARRDPKLAGVIVLAGNVRPLEELTIEQVEYLATLKGAPAAAAQKQIDNLKQEVDKIKKLAPGDANVTLLGIPIPAAYFLDLKDYNPAAEAKQLHTPMLILQGERDYQVTMKDFALWNAALQGRKDVTLKSYPALNHLFIAGEGKSTSAEYQKPAHVAPEVIEDIARWVSQTIPSATEVSTAEPRGAGW